MERRYILSGTFGFTEENAMKNRRVSLEAYNELQKQYDELKQVYEDLNDKYQTLRERCDSLCDRLANFGIRVSI